MIRRPPRSTQSRSSAASDVYKRAGTVGSHDERDPRALDRAGPGASVDRREVRATGRDVVLGQQPVEQLGELAEPFETLSGRQRRLAEDGVVDVAAGTDTAYEAAARDVVQGQQVAHERHGVAVVRRGDK